MPASSAAVEFLEAGGDAADFVPYEIGFHQLRHAAASKWLGDGWSIKAVSVWLGHSSTAVTATVYEHLLQRQRREGIEATDELVEAADELI